MNDKMNNVEVPVVVLKKKTVGRKKNTVGMKKKTFDIKVPTSNKC